MTIDKIKSSIREFLITIVWLLIPIFQYVPCASIWFGIMSVPLIGYLSFFFMNPSIAIMDFNFFLGYGFPWSFIIIASGAFFIFTLIYQIINRKKLILKGPYQYSRHPQYFAIIIMTFSLTMISLNTGPIAPFSTYLDGNRILLFLIWIIETGAYILLAKIEEFWLKKKYGRRYSEYKINVSFMIPIKTIQKIFKNNGDTK